MGGTAPPLQKRIRGGGGGPGRPGPGGGGGDLGDEKGLHTIMGSQRVPQTTLRPQAQGGVHLGGI